MGAHLSIQRLAAYLIGVAGPCPFAITAATIDGGSDHSIAAKDTRHVWARSANPEGRLGTASATRSASPILPITPIGVVAVAEDQQRQETKRSSDRRHSTSADASILRGI